ncbi:MAG: sigma-70 family RNA polymerase sigma factor [Phycisphaera sp.]|nr:sigma-70 family RNA polymerase sigma factor [Phycisphaera sp.]
MSQEDFNKQFVSDLIAIQPRLRAYVLGLLADTHAASDVLQEANVVIWERRGDFEPGTNFDAWVFTILRFQVMAHWSRRKRSRKTGTLSDDVLHSLAERAQGVSLQMADMSDALRGCLDRLTPRQRELIDTRYATNESVKSMADRLKRPVNTLYANLSEIRRKLHDCIRRKQVAEA